MSDEATGGSPDRDAVIHLPDSEDVIEPSREGDVVNPIASILETGSEPIIAPSARRFMSVLPWSALAAAFIVSLRILTVAHLNLSVALQLVVLTNTAQVLLGLAVIMFQPVLVIVALYVFLVCTETLHDAVKSVRSKKFVIISSRSLFFIFFLPPVGVLAIAFFSNTGGLLCLGGALFWILQRGWIDSRPSIESSSTPQARKKPGHTHRVLLIVVGVLMMGYGFSQVLLNDVPWLPPERIVLTNDTVMVGYIVSESNSDLTILRDSDRSIITLPTNKVKDQILCQIGGASGGSDFFVQLAWKSIPKVPACVTG
jgi:hypothetical protein